MFTKLFSHRERYSHSCVLTRTFTQVVSFNFPVQLFSAKIKDILQYIVCFISNAWQDISLFVCSRSMHTATNYYLFSLAVADLLTLLLGESHNKLLKMFLLIPLYAFYCRSCIFYHTFSVYEIRRPRRTLTTYFPIVRRNCQIRRTFLSGVNCRLPK